MSFPNGLHLKDEFLAVRIVSFKPEPTMHRRRFVITNALIGEKLQG